MDLFWSLVIYVVIFIVVFWIARSNRIRIWSAFIIALLIAGIILGIIHPAMTTEMTFNGSNLSSTLYWLILFATTILIPIYVVTMALGDKERR